MGTVFAYARVSTPRQGERGVSLQEQRDAITKYCERHGLEITRWFEERESASKKGRPAFTQMLRLLRLGRARGVVIHKIDRSARNLEDWNDIGKLVDAGVDVHFATENIDLKTTAGRLSADIQAVVATHYSRNLREEVKKGLYGRLKQGFYPWKAPVGYLDQGSARPKIPDPMRAPFVQTAFELYATGENSLPHLTKEMFRRGLRNRDDGKVSMNGLANILKNPFYVGLMRIKKTGQTFKGSHAALISTATYEEVQRVLAGKRVDRVANHVFAYSRIVRCATCGYSLIAERQKGHIYYRCHNRPFKSPAVCPPTSIREELIDEAVQNTLATIELGEEEVEMASVIVAQRAQELEQQRNAGANALQLQRDQIRSRMSKLTDLLLDGTIDRTAFYGKHQTLLIEEAAIDEQLKAVEQGKDSEAAQLERTVELAKSAPLLYKAASTENRRKLLKILLSNLAASGKNIEVTLAIPFQILAKRQNEDDGRLDRGTCRTWETTIQALAHYFKKHPEMLLERT